jgi:hypothetical protein
MFGTCGKTTWRKDLFIPAYEQMGLINHSDFFNPQVDNWKPELAQIEAEHLAEDSIILFPVTKETYGTGSLAETGFSILQAIKFDDRRDLVILIDETLDESLMADKVQAKESLRSRALVKQHIKKLAYTNLYVVDTLIEMRDLSISLYQSQKILKEYQDKYNPHKKFSIRIKT